MDLSAMTLFEELAKSLVSNELIEVEENNIEKNLELVEFMDLDEIVSEVKDEQNIIINESDLKYGYLAGTILDWNHSQGGNWLYGGYQFVMFESLMIPSNFWKIYNDPPSSEEQKLFLEDLVYFQKSGHGDDGTFGCFLRSQKFNEKTYFYDDGIYWEMTIGFDEYMRNLLKYKAVAAWQYFFVKPEEIVSELKNIPFENWSVSSVDVRNNRISGNKANAVLFQMDKILRLFPILFPDVELSEAQSKRDDLAQLLS